MRKVSFILYYLFFYTLQAQEIPDYTPPSPEATSLAKFIDIPVSLYTGMVNVSIPLHIIKTDDITIPINLSYHSRGIQVEEIAPRVGLGWALNYGGFISRQVRGKADEDGYYGYLKNGIYNEFFTNPDKRLSVLSTYLNHPNLDFTPDVFYFNVNGLSGKFIIDYMDKKPVVQNFSDLKIDYALDNDGKIGRFTIVDPAGNKYYFGISKNGRKARNYDQTMLTGVFRMNSGVEFLNRAQKYYYNSWQLMEIETVNGITIEYFYGKQPELSYYYKRSYDKKESVEPVSYFSKIGSNQYQLKRIEYPKGILVFHNSTIEREDISGAKTLDKIEIKDNNDHLIKAYKLQYKYTTAPTNSNQLDYLITVDSKASKRLFLTKIQEKFQGNNSNPPYIFQYEEAVLPNRFSNSQDIWGFYNGANNGSFLTFFDYGIHPVDRKVNPSLSGAGLLKKIIYPTGGNTTFTYEDNMAIPSPALEKMVTNDINTTILKTTGLSPFEASQYYNGIHYLKPFTIGGNDLIKVDIDVSIYGNSGCVEGVNTPNCKYLVAIKKENGDTYPIYMGHSDIFLPPGNHSIEVIPKNHEHNPLDMENGFNIILSWYEKTINENEVVFAGGKRIKRIDFKTVEGIVKTKEYSYKDNNEKSTGRLYGLPNGYFIDKNTGQFMVLEPYGMISGSPLTTAQGNKVGYYKVTEFIGNENNSKGKIEYTYTDVDDSGQYYEFPYHIPTDNEWLRGKEKTRTMYKKNKSGVFFPIKSIHNEYWYANEYTILPPYGLIYAPDYEPPLNSSFNFTPYPIERKLIENLTTPSFQYLKTKTKFRLPLVIFKRKDLNAPGTDQNGSNPLLYKTFYLTGGTADIKKTTITDFFDNGVISTKTTSFYFKNYTNHYQISKKEIDYEDFFGATNRRNIIKTYYPTDIKNNNSLYCGEITLKELEAINKLKLANRITIPIQVETYKDLNGDGETQDNELISVNRTNYKYNNIIKPKSIASLKGAYLPNINTLEDKLFFHSYYPNGKIKELSKPDGTHIYYIYGYQHTKPIAKIVNFTQAQAQSLQATINEASNLSDLDDDNMYIHPHGKEYALYQKLKQIQNSLPNTQMTFYTYDPLIGVTSITDPKGDTQYYIYDSFNRLKYIKDKEGHILKEYKYHYKLIPKPIVSDGIKISGHSISTKTVTFSVNTTSSSGSGGGLTYEWSVLSGGTAVGNSTSNQFSVQYTCVPNVQIEVQCTIRDVNFPDNNLTLSKTFNWNKCLSNGTLQVYPKYSIGLVKDLDKIEFKVANLSGGNGNLTYRWYYTDLNSNTGDTLIGTTTTPYFALTNTNSYCGKNFKAKCIVTDNVSGQQLILSNGVTYNFACFEINPDFHDIHPVGPH